MYASVFFHTHTEFACKFLFYLFNLLVIAVELLCGGCRVNVGHKDTSIQQYSTMRDYMKKAGKRLIFFVHLSNISTDFKAWFSLTLET
jgi:hypothetical protein